MHQSKAQTITLATGRGEVEKEPTEFISSGRHDERIASFLNDLFRTAARDGVSDVHFDDEEDGCAIRYRLDGVLRQKHRVSASDSRDIDAKIRSKTKLGLIERQAPLDGKFRFDVDGRFVDVRVSILPLGKGQSIVCRLLDQSSNLLKLDDLQMPEDIRACLRHIIAMPQGLLLVTGPTGSGKTTTLYGLLQQLNTPERKIITAEDPIEFRVAGISQAQTNPRLPFSLALKAMLRQDPDVILVGEIRDSETAKLANQAALTGHLVLSTLHTNSAPLTLTRLVDIGADPNIMAAAMGGYMAQRLVRRLCPQCRVPQPMNEYVAKQMLKVEVPQEKIDAVSTIYELNPNGCDNCRKGWVGRSAVYELIMPTAEVKLAVEEANLRALERAARLQNQYRTLAHDAMLCVLNGVTSIEEAVAVTGDMSFEG